MCKHSFRNFRVNSMNTTLGYICLVGIHSVHPGSHLKHVEQGAIFSLVSKTDDMSHQLFTLTSRCGHQGHAVPVPGDVGFGEAIANVA